MPGDRQVAEGLAGRLGRSRGGLDDSPGRVTIAAQVKSPPRGPTARSHAHRRARASTAARSVFEDASDLRMRHASVSPEPDAAPPARRSERQSRSHSRRCAHRRCSSRNESAAPRGKHYRRPPSRCVRHGPIRQPRDLSTIQLMRSGVRFFLAPLTGVAHARRLRRDRRAPLGDHHRPPVRGPRHAPSAEMKARVTASSNAPRLIDVSNPAGWGCCGRVSPRSPVLREAVPRRPPSITTLGSTGSARPRLPGCRQPSRARRAAPGA